MPDHDDYPEAGLPKSPPLDRRVCIPRGHALGLLLLACFPVLAVLGVFGSGERTVETAGGGVALAVTYAQRLRFGHPGQMKILVRSTGEQPLNGVRVQVDTSFLERFDKVSSIPEPKRVFKRAFEFVVEDGEREAVIAIHLEPEKYGAATGHIAVLANDRLAIELPVRSFILP